MSKALKNVDWDLLHRQKPVLLVVRSRQRNGSTEFEALSGIVHLLDSLQDEAVADGHWRFPNQNDEEVHDVRA